MIHARLRLALLIVLAIKAGSVMGASAQTGPDIQSRAGAPTRKAVPETGNWREIKCTRYKAAWLEALRRRGTGGLSQEFIATHDDFVAGGCTAQGHVCPRSEAELDLANILTIQAMNFGTASTFLPFACPSPARLHQG
jgi:hypothetical protein